ncbi:MAG: aminotransferase class IV [Candidatus Omnitrophica bacterium]|nr:aminotransferase class IV [Candidatus Omnitrophota bacterium]
MVKTAVFLNGKFIKEDKAKVSTLSPGFLYGWGLFETMRSRGNRIIYLQEHLKRLRGSAALIGLKCPYTLGQLEKAIIKTVSLSGAWDCYVKVVLSKSEKSCDIIIIAKKYTPPSLTKYLRGFEASISSLRQNRDNFLARIKSTSYLFYQTAYSEAKKNGCDEALILNNSGHICEGSRANLFFVKDDQLFTPSLECGCLSGVTRKFILDTAKKYRIRSKQGDFRCVDLYSCNEAFLTNSLIGVMPLSRLENRDIGKGSKRRMADFFMSKWNLKK